MAPEATDDEVIAVVTTAYDDFSGILRRHSADLGVDVGAAHNRGVQADKGGQYPRAIALQWDGRERSFNRADQLPPHSDPGAQRKPPSSARAVAGEALGFVLTGADPAGLRVLSQRTGRWTPVPERTSAWITSWAGLRVGSLSRRR